MIISPVSNIQQETLPRDISCLLGKKVMLLKSISNIGPFAFDWFSFAILFLFIYINKGTVSYVRNLFHIEISCFKKL